MGKTLLERFGIETPDDIEAYNLIGMDFGDGMVAAFKAGWHKVEKCVKLEKLYFAPGAAKQQTQNAVYLNTEDPSKDAIIFDAKQNSDEKGIKCYNFKRCPGDPSSNDHFKLDDDTLAPLTYAQVMTRAFNVMVNQLFEVNSFELDRSKPTIILVGRPSSSMWAQHEESYAKLLGENLVIRDYDQPVHVAVQSESTAALARQTDTSWHKDAVTRTDYVIVLDCGSSTFDVTLITPSGIPPQGGEDSRQFGGNLLDCNLLEHLLQFKEKKYPGSALKTKHGAKLDLRVKKEDFFGEDGKAQDDQVYTAYVALPDGSQKKFKMDIDEENMNRALNKMPVSYVEYDDFGFTTVTDADSWLDGCRNVFSAFYEKMKPFFPAGRPYPDKVILTGGVSIMPQVQQVAHECFGVEPVMSDRPNFAVAEGLAYVLGTEVVKKTYLAELMDDIKGMMSSSTYDVRRSIARVGAEEQYEIMKEAMLRWTNSDESYETLNSLNACWKQVHSEPAYGDLGTRTRKGMRNWYQEEKLGEKIQQKLEETFMKMFPVYAQNFSYEWNENDCIDALDGVVVMLKWQPKLLFGWFTGRKSDTDLFSASERHAVLEKFNSRSYEIKYGKETLLSSYSGFYDMYMNDIDSAIAQKLIDDLLKNHEAVLKDYVESITPYFTMTAKK